MQTLLFQAYQSQIAAVPILPYRHGFSVLCIIQHIVHWQVTLALLGSVRLLISLAGDISKHWFYGPHSP